MVGPESDTPVHPGWGLNDEEMLEPVWDFEFGEEFLELVIEYAGGPENREAFRHRMSKVRLN